LRRASRASGCRRTGRKYSRAALKARREKEHVDAAKADLDAAAAAAAAGDTASRSMRVQVSRRPCLRSSDSARTAASSAKPMMVPAVRRVAYAIEVGRPTTDSLPYGGARGGSLASSSSCVVLIDNFVVHLVNKHAEGGRDCVVQRSTRTSSTASRGRDDDVGARDLLDPAFSLYNDAALDQVHHCVLVRDSADCGLLIDDFRCVAHLAGRHAALGVARAAGRLR
jgi:hypothetical protein